MSLVNRLLGLLVVAAIGTTAHASQLGTYYVGVDDADTVTYGTYSGEYNTNEGRLTLLFHHGNHFHGIGTHSYTGPASSPVASDTSSNNRLPESYTGLNPISLQPGSGDFAGTYRSGLSSSLPQDLEYGNLNIQNVHSLSGVDDVIYNSSGGRWNTDFDLAHIHMVLLNATPGLNIAFGNTPVSAVAPGGDFHLGDGDEMFSVTPTFWVDDTANVGDVFTAEFMLADLSGTYGNSGRFFVDFQAVPEPAACTFLASGGLLAFVRRRRKVATK
ncbi:all3515 family Zur-repressed PEP-CTERM protein [Roseiconus lacunae]|uniref:all3515 family Zur-repressed PEP-CTERM protein n=1 Tax=Roseiconus lacunae TaxID=2605694 RepID=UPI0011F1DEBC|nr:all3515 family Zur-repressed PEP-CTERM protein [Roseiconus lacunae]MCD0463758.1 all3515 family Zur-repressed PEP-CTERM protein [Roseiconus lacunae]WRQ50267.1 all3515 family Zur-repressed PEP-CTERM protein [Stieleria sp. HD01]